MGFINQQTSLGGHHLEVVIIKHLIAIAIAFTCFESLGGSILRVLAESPVPCDLRLVYPPFNVMPPTL